MELDMHTFIILLSTVANVATLFVTFHWSQDAQLLPNSFAESTDSTLMRMIRCLKRKSCRAIEDVRRDGLCDNCSVYILRVIKCSTENDEESKLYPRCNKDDLNMNDRHNIVNVPRSMSSKILSSNKNGLSGISQDKPTLHKSFSCHCNDWAMPAVTFDKRLHRKLVLFYFKKSSDGSHLLGYALGRKLMKTPLTAPLLSREVAVRTDPCDMFILLQNSILRKCHLGDKTAVITRGNKLRNFGLDDDNKLIIYSTQKNDTIILYKVSLQDYCVQFVSILGKGIGHSSMDSQTGVFYYQKSIKIYSVNYKTLPKGPTITKHSAQFFTLFAFSQNETLFVECIRRKRMLRITYRNRYKELEADTYCKQLHLIGDNIFVVGHRKITMIKITESNVTKVDVKLPFKISGTPPIYLLKVLKP